MSRGLLEGLRLDLLLCAGSFSAEQVNSSRSQGSSLMELRYQENSEEAWKTFGAQLISPEGSLLRSIVETEKQSSSKTA